MVYNIFMQSLWLTKTWLEGIQVTVYAYTFAQLLAK